MKKKWYKGKVFVITGAAGGIGSAVCRLFAKKGMRMYLLDLPSPDLDALVDEVKELGAEHAEAMAMDVTNREQVEQAIKTIGEKEKYIDILHNNAGIGNKCSITNGGTFEGYRRLMSINIDGMWLVLQAALPYIGRPVKKPPKKYPQRREGQLIFTSSAAGKVGLPNMAAYCASKYGIVGLANALRGEYKMQGHKIQSITICPAPAKTKFWDSTPEFQEWVKKYQKKGFIYSFVTPEHIARHVEKASRKNTKEVMVPRWTALLKFFHVLSIGLVQWLMMKIEKKTIE